MLTTKEKNEVRIVIAEKISGLGNADAIAQVMEDYAALPDDLVRKQIAEYKTEKITELTDLSDCLAQQKSDVDKQISDLIV